MIETIVTSIASFIGTNIDDIFINTIFFAKADTKRKVQSVVAGKYLGIGFLVLVSYVGGYFLHSVPEKYISLLGFIPITLGIKEWISCLRGKRQTDSSVTASKTDISKGVQVSVMLVTISNGADNIGVYMPLFANYTGMQMTVVLLVFILMIELWCFLGMKLSDLPGLRGFLTKYMHIIVPAVFVILGIYIFVKAML